MLFPEANAQQDQEQIPRMASGGGAEIMKTVLATSSDCVVFEDTRI